MLAEPGTILSGKFCVLRLIGAGGMGAVYEVEHTLTKHRRALKMLHKEFASNRAVVQRFLNEASAAGRIGNRHIVETFDAGVLDNGDPYIVMELLMGQSLAQHLKTKGRLDFAEAFEILKQASAGLQAAHDAGIIHRDIKPENLFLVASSDIFVKIVDFGISKFDPAATGSATLTQEGSTLGTPYYMPVEQLSGQPIDVRADVYSLGVVLYECITGQKPFYADTLPQIAILIHEGKYAPLEQRRPDTPKGLSEIVAKAMSVDCEQRYASVHEFCQALSRTDLQAPARQNVALEDTLPLDAAYANTVRAGTSPTPVAGKPAGRPARSRRLLVLLAALTALTALALGLLSVARKPASPEEMKSVASAPPPPAAALPAEKRTPAAPEPEAQPDEQSTGIAPEHGKSSPRKKSSRPPTRAEEHGLSQENPF